MTLIDPPSAAQVAAYLGETLDQDDPERSSMISAVLANTVTAARSHCRGVGFTDDGKLAADLAGVVLSCTARIVNTSPGIIREEAGSYSVVYADAVANWTVRELVTLNAYRRTAT